MKSVALGRVFVWLNRLPVYSSHNAAMAFTKPNIFQSGAAPGGPSSTAFAAFVRTSGRSRRSCSNRHTRRAGQSGRYVMSSQARLSLMARWNSIKNVSAVVASRRRCRRVFDGGTASASCARLFRYMETYVSKRRRASGGKPNSSISLH